MAQSFDEFLNKWNGKKCDFDKAYGAQCVDLFRQYCQDVLAIPHTGGVEGAKDLFLNYDKMPLEKKYFERVFVNPVSGDVAVWGATETNKYGHVALVLGNVDGRSILVAEQDGFKQDGVKFKIRSCANLIGFLRFKK
jgi:hypothetical protein